MANKEDLNTRKKCGTCNAIMICKEVEYQGNVKYQWQDDDGKAHYRFDINTKKSYCKKQEEGQPSGEQLQITAPYSIDDKIADAKKVTKAFAELMKEIGIEKPEGLASVWNTMMMRKDR